MFFIWLLLLFIIKIRWSSADTGHWTFAISNDMLLEMTHIKFAKLKRFKESNKLAPFVDWTLKTKIFREYFLSIIEKYLETLWFRKGFFYTSNIISFFNSNTRYWTPISSICAHMSEEIKKRVHQLNTQGIFVLIAFLWTLWIIFWAYFSHFMNVYYINIARFKTESLMR